MAKHCQPQAAKHCQPQAAKHCQPQAAKHCQPQAANHCQPQAAKRGRAFGPLVMSSVMSRTCRVSGTYRTCFHRCSGVSQSCLYHAFDVPRTCPRRVFVVPQTCRSFPTICILAFWHTYHHISSHHILLNTPRASHRRRTYIIIPITIP